MRIAADPERDRIRAFLLSAAKHAGTDLTGLARRAGLSPSTLTRFVNKDAKHIPTTRTLSKIAAVSGYSLPDIERPSRPERLAILADVAAAMNLDLVDAAFSVGAEPGLAIDAAALLRSLAKLPASAQKHIYGLAVGMADPIDAADQQINPTKSGLRRTRA